MPAPDDSTAHPAAGMPDDMQTIAVAKPVAATLPEVAVMGANPDSPVPFVFGKRIAKGGMGAILEGEDCKLGRTIAVKVMLDPHASGEQARRFVQEAAVLGRLEHPNIVPIHDLGRDSEGALYYTMKLVKGRTLQDILNDLRQEKKDALEHYTLDRLLTIFRKVCDALAFAHANNIIHRDLKPENVMVGEFGEVLVMDWGIAKIMGELGNEVVSTDASARPPVPTSTGSFTATMDGAVMGTPNYMSPEQAMGKVNELDERSDIFSLGGILYAILTLRPPVEGKDVWEVLEKVQAANITSPTTFGATSSKGTAKAKGDVLEAKKITPLPHMPGGRVPNALSAVVMKALTLDKTKRYQNIAAFSADIEAYQGGFATTAEQAGLAKQLALLIKRNKGIFTTAAAAWLLITALGLWFMFNLRAKEQRALAGEQKATAAEAVAVREKETARQALAKSQLDLAEKEFERGKFVESQKILGETPESFRDANWRFLQAHSRDYSPQLSLAVGAGAMNWLRFLPQGDRFAGRRWGGAIGVFTVTGRQIGDWIPVSGGNYDAFGIDSTGERMAFPVSASEIAVQEVGSSKLVGRWPCEPGESKQVILSPDGGTVLVAGGVQINAHAAQTGARLWSQPFHGALPAFSPDGRSVAVLAVKNGLDLKIHLLDTAAGAVLSTLVATADKPNMTALQFNQAGDQLACLGGDEVILWNAKTTAKVRALHFPGETVKLLSPSGTTVATINGSRIRLWDTRTGRLLRSLHGASAIVNDVAFSPDEKLLISGHAVGVPKFWPVRLDEGIASARVESSGGRRVLFGRDGTGFYALARHTIAALETRGSVQRWKFLSERLRFLDLAEHPTDGSIVLSEQNNKTLIRLSSTGEAAEAFGSSANPSLKFNRSGKLLLNTVDCAFASAKPGWAFRVAEYPSGNVLREINLPTPLQPFATFCLDDAAVATAASAGGITVWDWQASKLLRQIEATQTGSIACFAASPDGRHLATGGPDRWIRVWEAGTGQMEAAFRAHWEGVRSLKFSPDGREILSGSEDGSVRIHDATTGEEKLAFYGFTAPVADVDISADGTLIAAITTDGFTQVWDRQISSAAAQLPKVAGAVEPVAAASPAATNTPSTTPTPSLPKKPKPVLPKDADGWEDLLAPLTPDEVEKTGHGWSLKDGVLVSPEINFATLPLPAEVPSTSYRVRVKLRQVSGQQVFHIVLPVADRMCGFELEGRPHRGIYTGLTMVNGKFGKDLPGVVEGKQVNDTASHELEVTVRLDGANASITTKLDDKPLYEWTGPTAALNQMKVWATTEPGALALGTYAGGWVVSEVKVKRVEK